MPSTLVATVGSASANSYITVEAADAYFDDRLKSSAWTGAAAEDKTRALLQATRRIDRAEFVGFAVKPRPDTETSSPQQALKWPRQGAVDSDGWTYDDDEIPQIVQDATCELAIDLLKKEADGIDAFEDTGLEGFKSVGLAGLSVTPRHAQKADDFPQHVQRILEPVLLTKRGTFRMVRS